MSASDPQLKPSTQAAILLIEEWTEDEALFSWFFLAGLNSSIVDEVNEHVMKMRELNSAYVLGEVTTE